MTIEHEDELEALRRVGQLVARVMRHMRASVEAGMTTAEIDAIGERMLADAGAQPAPRLSVGFPGATCISVGEEVAHGVPGPRVVRRGELMNIDVSAELDGFFADTGMSFVVGESPSRAQEKLLRATQAAMHQGIQAARHGHPLRLIGKRMEEVARRAGYGVMRDLCSHGVGRALHEAPGHIPGYHDPALRGALWEGCVITVEPFLTTGALMTTEAADGWTLRNRPGSMTAQFEHTIVVTRGAPVILTLPD